MFELKKTVAWQNIATRSCYDTFKKISIKKHEHIYIFFHLKELL